MQGTGNDYLQTRSVNAVSCIKKKDGRDAAFESLTNLRIIKKSIHVIQVYIFILKKSDRNIILLKPLVISDLLNGNTLYTSRDINNNQTEADNER